MPSTTQEGPNRRPRRLANVALIQAMVKAKRARAAKRLDTLDDMLSIDPYVLAGMDNADVAASPACREVLQNVRTACQLLNKALRSEGFGPCPVFFGMQRHALCVMLKAKFIARYGRTTMALIVGPFEAELKRHGFAEESEFWTDADVRSMARSAANPTTLYKRVTLLQSRRQYGKSLCMQYLAAVYLTIFPHEVVCLVSNHSGLNDQNRAEVVRLLRVFGQEFDVVNSTAVWLTNGNCMLVKTQQGLRGVRPTTILVDEAAFCRVDVFSRKLAPIMVNPNRVLHAFTTPNGDNLAWCSLMEEDEEFRVMQVRDVCEDCEAEGQKSCLCLAHHAPDVFQSAEVQRLVRAFYKMDPQAYLEEVLGITVASDMGALPVKWVDLFLSEPRWPFEHAVVPHRKRIYLSYDPTTHNVSGTAFLAFVQDHATRQIVLVHLDYEIFVTETVDSGVKRLVTTLTAQLAQRYPGHTIITALEANSSVPQTQRVAGWISSAGAAHNMQVVHQSHQHKRSDKPVAGLWVDHNTKLGGYIELRRHLELRKLYVAPDVSTSALAVTNTRASAEALLADRLDSLRLQLIALKVSNGAKHQTISGKDKGKSVNDDLAITMVNAFYLMCLTRYHVETCDLPDEYRDTKRLADQGLLPSAIEPPRSAKRGRSGRPSHRKDSPKRTHRQPVEMN